MSYKLYNGDCLELMDKIPDKSIDMVLCDLPYGTTANEADIALPFDKLWSQYSRVVKDNGAIVLFAQGLFYIDLVNSNRALFRYDLVWDKGLITGFLNAHNMPLRQHEQIAVFYKEMPTYNPQMTQGSPLHGRGKAYMVKDNKNNNYGSFGNVEDTRKGSTEKYPTSILYCQKPHPSVAVHRTEKPVPLLEYLIKTYTNEGDTVLDNTMGSGSTGVACLNTERNFVGIELDSDYFEICKKRMFEINGERAEEIIGDATIAFGGMLL